MYVVVDVCCHGGSETTFGRNVLVNNVVIKMYAVIGVAL